MVIREAVAAATEVGQEDVAKVWLKITTQNREAVNRWSTVKGPLGALYVHFSEGGWKMGFGPSPERQLCIFSHKGEQWTAEPGSGWVEIQRSMDKRRVAMLWTKAAEQGWGQGKEDGID